MKHPSDRHSKKWLQLSGAIDPHPDYSQVFLFLYLFGDMTPAYKFNRLPKHMLKIWLKYLLFLWISSLKDNHQQIRREQPILPCLQVWGFCGKDFNAGIKMQQANSWSIPAAKDVSWVSGRHCEPYIYGCHHDIKSKLQCLDIFLPLCVENEAEQSPWPCGDGCEVIITLADSQPKVGRKKVRGYWKDPGFSKTCSAGVWDGIAP